MNVFCLPFAGASGYSYHPFTAHAGDGINILPLELPGRGNRTNESLVTNINEMADDLFCQIFPRIHEPYCIYGHSMGSLLGYLITKNIVARRSKPPVHLFFSGRGGPSVRYDRLQRHLLPRPVFHNELRELGGVTDDMLSNEVLMEFFEPILRADFAANDGFSYSQSEPFSIPITVFIGSQERTTEEEAYQWQQETTAAVKVYTMPGRHFFIFDHVAEILRIINTELLIPRI